MAIVLNVSTLALKLLVDGACKAVGLIAAKEGTDAVVNFLLRRFTDQSQRLTTALQHANAQGWKAIELALAGDSLWDRCRVLMQPREVQAFRQQVQGFLDNTPLADHGGEFRMQCLRQLRLARKAGLLTDGVLEPKVLAERAGAFARFADPASLLTAEGQVLDDVAIYLRDAGCPALARFVALRPREGAPVLAAAVRYFFRRQVELDRELFQGLVVGQLEALDRHQQAGLDALTELLGQHGAQLEAMLDDVRAVLVETHGDVLDIKWELQRQGQQMQELGQAVLRLLEDHRLRGRALRPDDSLAIAGDGDRRLVRALMQRFLALPDAQRRELPALQNGLGMLEVAAGDFESAQRCFEGVAVVVAEPTARAAARHNAFRAALERRQWDEALADYREAAATAPERFGLFPTAKYEPLRILGAGGFGVVFLCRHRNSGSRVVVKALRLDGLDREVSEVFREAQVLEELEHPAIVRLRDCDFADAGREHPYLVMDYFEGQTLADLIQQQGALTADDLRALAVPVADALHAAHRRGVLHRDVKPANLLVRRDDGGWRVKLIDFGLALKQDVLRQRASERTAIGASVAGTLDYAAPEQMGRLPGARIGPHSDVFGFGKTCCFALFRTAQPLRKHWRALPEPLADLLEACLAEAPDERPKSFAEVAHRLGPAVSAPPPPAPPVVAPEPPRPEPRERFWAAAPSARVPEPRSNQVRSFTGHEDAVTCLAFSPDGQWAASGSADRTIRLWEVASGREVRCLHGHGNSVLAVAFAPDGKQLLSGSADLTLRCWDVERGREVRCFSGWVHRCLALAADGRQALSGSPYDGMVRLWDLETGREVRRFKGHATGVRCVAFAPDGRRALSGGGEAEAKQRGVALVDCAVRVWEVESGRMLRSLEGHAGPVTCLAVSPDGRLAVSGSSQDATLRWWDILNGRPVGQCQATGTGFAHLAFTPDGRRLAACQDGTLWVWDVPSRQAIAHLKADATRVLTAAIAPDGECVLTGGEERMLRLWKLPR
ncbi:MAG: serine/threonine protein kinase [Planctomycetia bacterium]|nr:serine/threonine protein kinase [Planctomycetia bacterium]